MKFRVIKSLIKFIFFAIVLFSAQCTKPPIDPLVGWGDKISLVTGTNVTLTPTSAIINNSSITCSINTLVGKERGICWSDSAHNLNVSGKKISSESGTGTYSTTIPNLLPGKIYYYKAFIIIAPPAAALYGESKNFTTPATCPPTTTNTTTAITYTTANTGGNVTADGGASVTARGVVVSSTNTTPVIGSATNYPSGTGTGSFTVSLASLIPGTTYYVRAYATNSAGTCYGTTSQFATQAVTCPTVASSPVASVLTNSAIAGGNITADGGASVTARGLVISTTNTSPAIGTGTNYPSGTGTGPFTVDLSSLSAGTTYYVRAYATNSAGTCYGNAVQFTTNAVCPTITTSATGAIQATTATTGGNVTYDGGSSVTARGVVISTTNTSPAIGSGTSYVSGSGTGLFTVNLSNLFPATIYYVRAYAINAAGTCYGVTTQFTTDAICPTVTTSSAGSIQATNAIAGGNVTATGGASVTARGVVISSSNTNPAVGSGTNYPSGAGTGSFAVNLTSLNPGTTYYMRAYATNAAGTCYGSTMQFTTIAICPTLSTGTTSGITYTAATSGGNITDDGGATVIARGVIVSSTNPSPAIGSGTSYPGGAGEGIFTVNLTSLSPGTKYYVRAYATNSAGTCYGNTVQFTTQNASCPPTITNTTSEISYTTATSGGNIMASGGSPVIASGLVISSTNTLPAIGSAMNYPSGATSGAFTDYFSNLSPGTTYYVRAYATNTTGTCYGNVVQFRTMTYKCPTVTTSAASDILSTSVTLGGHITDDGGRNVTSRGIVISSTNSSPAIGSGTNYSGGSGTGLFTVNLSTLSINTTYYVRAYATNSVGTCYGSTIQFTTRGVCPTVSTSTITRTSSSTANLGGNVSSQGSSTVTQRGILLTINNGTPTTYPIGSGTGTFSSNFSGFVFGRTYTVQAYATNSSGTCYGSIFSIRW
jgi:hypothetical protein